MGKTLDEVKQEVWAHLKETQCVYLATAEGLQPRVRPVTLLDIDEKFWIATGTGSSKAKQMQSNPNVEFCLPLPADNGVGYIRVAGEADAVVDPETKATIGGQIPFLNDFWTGVDDPNFCLLRITRVEIEYMRPGEFEPHTFLV